MWHKRQRHHQFLKGLLLFGGRRRFVRLALALLCVLTVVAILMAFSQKRQSVDDSDNLTPSPPPKCCECADQIGTANGWRSHFVPAEAEARVFQSVRREHIQLLSKLYEAQSKMDIVDKKIAEKEAELAKLELRVDELKLLQKEYSDSRAVRVQLPHSPPPAPKWPRHQKHQQQHNFKDTDHPKQHHFDEGCDEENGGQFDFSRCSIAVQSMPLFVYPPLSEDGTSPSPTVLATQFYRQFVSGQRIASLTTEPARACLFVTIIDQANASSTLLLNRGHFGAGGKNLLVLDLRGQLSSAAAIDQQQLGSAVLITPRTDHSAMRRGQLLLPLHLDVPLPNADRWRELPALLPVMRKYFVRLVANPALLNRRQINDVVELRKSMDSSQDAHLIDLDCPLSLHNVSSSPSDHHHFCYDVGDRLRMGRQSLFTILLLSPESPSFQQLFYESLLSGSIPVLYSSLRPPATFLPFGRFIDWRLATVQIAPDRFPELHFILRAIPVADLVELKRKGRFFFEHYLADTKVLVRAILSAMRVHLQLPGGEQTEPEAVPLYRSKSNNGTGSLSTLAVPTFISTLTKPPYDDEYLGPIELSVESPSYEHNFTALSLYSGQIWNNFPMALDGSPRFFPFAHFLPSDAEFSEDTAFGMRPILPGSGQEFALALGGNRPREQFTIIILAYNREHVLLNMLERLNNLPYLNRVLVVWNDPHRLPSIPAWPRLHVPVLFINGTRNSLNNRFIPYKQIETEAILSVDDDMDMKQFEIVFAFRVWRQHRDRIVGFPARFHARFGEDNFYNSNHTCQYSMILTGAAFIHKFYLHAYTYHMPETIRHKVDEWMNCEDLAMNFLVSHLTRKAPIKTTSKWTLRCPSCPEMLSNDQHHFVERHECIRFFTRVYGYNPLVFSQFRADSVLFKTRVPQNHQKCFRYV